MNTELRLVHNITSSNRHGKSAKDNRFTDFREITGHGRKQHQVAKFRARNQHATGLKIVKQGMAVFY